jgi:hypothetical protein
MTAEEVEVQLAKEGAVPIYAIGFSGVRERTQRLAGLAALGRWARHSGGLFTATHDTVLEQSFAAMRERIRAVDRMDLRCVSCVADGNRYRLRDDGLQSLSC